MSVYLHELKSYRKSTFWWSVSIALLMAAAIAKFDAFQKSGESVNDLFKSLPPGLSALFGVTGVDLTTASGYFVVTVAYTAIMLGVHAVLIGSGIVAKEETEHTAEFLYTKPASRWKILAPKLLAALTIVVILNLVTLVASVIGMDSVVEPSSVNNDILFLMPSLLGIQVYFLTVGFAFASIMRRPKRAGQWAAGVLVTTFIAYSVIGLNDNLDFLKYLTAFQYFDAKQIFNDHAYDSLYLVIAGVTIAALVTASFIRFQRRDLDT